MGNEFWFRPKSYGYGATPVTWEGWALVAVHVVVLAACMMTIMMALQDKNFRTFAVAIVVAVITTAGIVWLSRVKTDGNWQWRWGKPDEQRKNGAVEVRTADGKQHKI